MLIPYNNISIKYWNRAHCSHQQATWNFVRGGGVCVETTQTVPCTLAVSKQLSYRCLFSKNYLIPQSFILFFLQSLQCMSRSSYVSPQLYLPLGFIPLWYKICQDCNFLLTSISLLFYSLQMDHLMKKVSIATVGRRKIWSQNFSPNKPCIQCQSTATTVQL